MFPNGKRFAFAIIDDTDEATTENVRPIYRLLEALGMRATKTVWPVACEEGSKVFGAAETLEDLSYKAFVLDLQRRGFEIAFHCATMESSMRGRTVRALDQFRNTFGSFPRVHANHADNRENLYWGPHRVDDPLLRLFLRTQARRVWPSGSDHFQGHCEGSPYWWGDLCSERIEYVRNLTFSEINLLNVNPTMPYRDPQRPHVRWWFSGADAEDVDAFVELVSDENQDRLEREAGVCIVATHLGKRFCNGGAVRDDVARLLTRLSSKPGWFPNVGELLDWMQERTGGDLMGREWRRMQRRWFRDTVIAQVRRRLRRRAASRAAER